MQTVTKILQAVLIKKKKKLKNTARGKGHYILAKCSIQQEALTVINICIPNNRSAKGMKQKLTELRIAIW